MFSINKLSIQFSGEWLFRHISFLINQKDRIGLVGKNGAGKSTLLRCIAGEMAPDEGEIVIPKDMSVGFLRQHMDIDDSKTVMETAREAFADALRWKELMESLSEEISKRQDYDNPSYLQLINEFHHAEERFRMLDGLQAEGETEKVLKGLGFLAGEFDLPLYTFSGGWQMRVELAKLLLRKDDLLLLDEPTNHLDIESIQWLEGFLKTYPGAIIVVSHDRTLLDRLTDRTLEVELGKLHDYKYSYSKYAEMRLERLSLQTAAFNNQQRQIAQIERFIERFRYKNTKAKQVQSRVKMLEKMDRIEVEDADASAIRFRFPPAPRAGKVITESGSLSKSYDDKLVLDRINFNILRNEFIAFVGKNGEGKTTLSKIIAGQLEYQGELKYGHNVSIGYYAQDQAEQLDGDKTVFETLDEVATGEMRTRVRGLLGNFLFSDESIDKKVRVLSGGERSRLALAKLLLEPVSLLVLDEPTNHLDMLAKDVLKNALLQYDGTLIVVSHDRDFLHGLTDRILEFRNKQVHEYRGDIYGFLEMKQVRDLDNLGQKTRKDEQKKPALSSDNKRKYEERKAYDRELRKARKALADIEANIGKLEKEKAEMEAKMADPASLGDAADKVYSAYSKIKSELDDAMWSWESAHTMVEQLEKEAPVE